MMGMRRNVEIPIVKKSLELGRERAMIVIVTSLLSKSLKQAIGGGLYYPGGGEGIPCKSDRVHHCPS